jgi:hypothetical protein
MEPKVPWMALRPARRRINIGHPAHDPEKWVPLFGSDHAQTKCPKEVVMAKGQMRAVKEKKKPKADKDKPKQMSAYKLAQTQGSAGNPFGNPPKK